MKSWKTSLFGLMAAIGGGIVGAYATGIITADELPRWVKTAAVLMSIVGGSGLGFFARDNNVTSEQAGAPGASHTGSTFLLLLLASLLSVGSVGCAYVKMYDNDRKAGFVSVVPAWPWQDSMRSLDRMNVSAKTNGFTASLRGLQDSETTSTNAVDLVGKVTEAAVSAAIRSVKP